MTTYYNLGSYSRPITTTSPLTQLWFDRGLIWCYGFNHEEASRCFHRALSHDPDCALAYWGIGIPAGYVSGFLRTNPPPGKPRLEGADAMHAWVRAWCGWQTGWIEYDPTNALIVGADHILIARGRDYGDVSPVKGVLKIAGDQKSEQAVDVLPVPEVVA